MAALRFRPKRAATQRATIAPLVFCACVALAALVLHSASRKPAPEVLMVVVSIGREHSGIAADSQRAYAERHGYRLHVQREWRGTAPRPKHDKAPRAQKLIACTLAERERYVLVLDADIVIAPWTPPIHLHAPAGKIGIVDEDQPDKRVHDAVIKLRTAPKRDDDTLATTVRTADEYGTFFARYRPKHGLLNSGMLLLETKRHCQWLQNVYYAKEAQQYFAGTHTHYDQPVLGSALLGAQNYQRMHHAWNRGWIFYKDAHKVGGLNYTLEQVFRGSYFVHFYWDIDGDSYALQQWMARNRLSFDPQPYATELIE